MIKIKGKKRKALLELLLFFRRVVDVLSIYGENQHPSLQNIFHKVGFFPISSPTYKV